MGNRPLQLLTLSILASHIAICEPCNADELTVESALGQRIIDPQLPLKEIQAYTEARILPMPENTSVEEWETYAHQVRKDVFEKVVFKGEAAEWRKIPTKAEWTEDIEGGPGYRIRKLRYEVIPGMWVAALLYEPENLTGKVPVIMNVNGHEGDAGKAAEYKQMRCINQAKRGMIALNIEWLGMGQLNTPGFVHYCMNQMNLCGTSGLAPFYLSMSRGLDVLLQHDNADPERVGVTGLSGGGWQTIFISSLDTRVTLCNPVAGYSSFKTRSRFVSDLGDSEQTPCDLASVTDYAQLTAMLAPRAALLTNNASDNCCFKAEHALPPLLAAATPIYRLYNKTDLLRHYVNHDPGSHNFLKDNRQQLYKFLGDVFYPDATDFDATEIACEGEIKTKAELIVELPADNLDFNTTALRLCDKLTRSLPNGHSELKLWQEAQRPKLQEIVRNKELDLLPILQLQKETEDLSASWWWLRLGGDWTVPAVELSIPGTNPTQTVITVSEDGRAATAEHVQQLLESGKRVLAIDPFFFGESKIASRDFLYAILVSSTGNRPLGIQARQLEAVANWARDQFGCDDVQISAFGSRMSLIALTATALSDNVIDGVALHGSLGSLRELLEQNMRVSQVPESLCFGLLKEFDIQQLVALAGPKKVTFAAPSDRCRTEMSPLVQSFPQATQKLLAP